MPVAESIVRTSGSIATRSEFDVLDRNADPALDELTEFTAVLSGADYAYLGWMDFNRLWFKSRFGFMATDQPRTSSVCRYVVEDGKPMLLADAAADPRFMPEGIEVPGCRPCRSYAAIPLKAANQHIVGTRAILARRPHQFAQEHMTLLEVVGRQII